MEPESGSLLSREPASLSVMPPPAFALACTCTDALSLSQINKKS